MAKAKAVTKEKTQKAVVKKTETKKESDANISVFPHGGKAFLIKEEKGGVKTEYISKTNPLEEND